MLTDLEEKALRILLDERNAARLHLNRLEAKRMLLWIDFRGKQMSLLDECARAERKIDECERHLVAPKRRRV